MVTSWLLPTSRGDGKSTMMFWSCTSAFTASGPTRTERRSMSPIFAGEALNVRALTAESPVLVTCAVLLTASLRAFQWMLADAL